MTPVRARLVRFARRPLRDKWGAVRATLRHLRRQLMAAARRGWEALDERKRRQRVFRGVYRNHLWGSDAGSQFFSGVGSRGESADIYVKRLAALLERHAEELGRAPIVVDLGCGDFAIGRALVARLPDLTYIGCDIVPELIAHHTRAYASDRVGFRRLDLVADPLPSGDVCLVRQVLQHLSNAEVIRFLRRADYRYLYVTEGHPAVRSGPLNPDKTADFDVRFDWAAGRGRGLELDQPPFSLVTQEMFRTCERPNEIIITERVLSPSPRPVAASRPPLAAVAAVAANTDSIPRSIFQTWKSKTDIPAKFSHWQSTFDRINPDFRHIVWDDDDNRQFIASYYEWFLPIYDSYPREIYRVDAVRYFYLYTFGGIYADMDTECLRPLAPLLGRGDVLLG
ncbi:MAG: glycosyltransferase, partial [Stellaceae bacterium]